MSEAEEELYNIEAILDKRYNPATRQYLYLIKWEGYEDDSNTWEPKENVQDCIELLAKFERRWERKQKRTKEMQKEKMRTMAEKRNTSGVKRKNPLDSSSESDEEKSENSEWEEWSEVALEVVSAPIETKPPEERVIQFTHEPVSSSTDLAERIIGVRGTPGSILYAIGFKRRRDGSVPFTRIMHHTDLAAKLPHLLVDFLLQHAN